MGLAPAETCPWRITELGRESLNLTDVTSYIASLYVIHFNGAPNFDEAQVMNSRCTDLLRSTGSQWAGRGQFEPSLPSTMSHLSQLGLEGV